MSLTSRKARPLVRREGDFRDDRLLIVACDDTYAPKQYFDFFRIPRVQVHVVETVDGSSSAIHVIDRLLSYEHLEDDELWMVLDTDHYIHGAHLRSFASALQRARQSGVNVALSRPCFEVWLLLHFVGSENVQELGSAVEVVEKLREVAGPYSKKLLRECDYPMDAVRHAISESMELDSRTAGGDIPAANTTRVYKIWLSLIRGAGRTQVPEPLSEFLADDAGG